MNITQEKHDGIDIIALSGRFVMADAAATREHLLKAIECGQGKLLLDLEQVTFMDSSACAVVVSAFNALRAASGRLVLVTSPVVQSLLELTRLHTLFEIRPSRAAAVAALAGGAAP